MNDFNISVAEVDALNRRQQAILGLSLVSNDARFVRSCLDKVIQRLHTYRSVSLIDYQVELI